MVPAPCCSYLNTQLRLSQHKNQPALARPLLMASRMRFAKPKLNVSLRVKNGGLKIGFVPTIDSAVLISAQELGLFEKYGLSVKLMREVGWATIREKLMHEELDGAATPATMALSIYCGLSVLRRPVLTGLILGANGSAITLSKHLEEAGVRDAQSLGRHIRKNRPVRKLVFAAVLELSTQNHDLRKWLRSGGIDPEKDVDITVIPSALVYDSLKEGYLDGYCVGEPWSSLAAHEKVGWVAAECSDINPGQPEKVLLVLQEFADQREEEHIRLLAALIEASQFCDAQANRRQLAKMLSLSRYLDVGADLLERSLAGPLQRGRNVGESHPFVVFDSFKIGAPSRANGKRALEVVQSLLPPGGVPSVSNGAVANIFRNDLFDRAAALYKSKANEVSVDGGTIPSKREIDNPAQDQPQSIWGPIQFPQAVIATG